MTQPNHTAESPGRLITLEGGEGAGKSTLLVALASWLEELGIPVVVTREPGGTRLGEAIRSLVLDPANGPVFPETELLLMFAARSQHVREVIVPALQAGSWVLCDRYVDASFAYQGAGRGQAVERIQSLADWVLDGVEADRTLLLDLPVEAGRARLGTRAVDRIESEQQVFFERVRQGYLDRAGDEPGRFRVLDAAAPTEAVFQAARQALAGLLPAPETGAARA